MSKHSSIECADCGGFSRRDFLLAASAAAISGALPNVLRGAEAKSPIAETRVKELYDTLTSDQRKVLCFPFDHPLRKKVGNNWAITKPTIEQLEVKQQDLVEAIVKGLSSPEGFEKFSTQMADDHGGMGNYHIAIFGEPGQKAFEFVLTGRHVTMRADGNSVEGAAFGGPMFYGHACGGFNEKANHPGNVFWYQAKRANEVFAALNKDQRAKALAGKSPQDNEKILKPLGSGVSVGEMSSDQKELVKKVMADLLSPYRKEDVDEVMEILTANGGLDRTKMTFFQLDESGKNADIGNDGVWDVWRLEGPGFTWHFRGAPHVHTWVDIRRV